MKKCIGPLRAFLLITAFVILAVTEAESRVAVLPYRVNLTSAKLKADTGRDYARLLALTLRLSKKVDVASYRDVSADLTRAGINYRKKITASDLERLGRSGLYEYILLGTLSSGQGALKSRSLLYSVREKRVLARYSSRAYKLPLLAQKDIREGFAGYRDRSFGSSSARLDLLVMIDLSANMRREWPALRRDLLRRAGEIIDTAGVDTRLYILPFGKNFSYRHVASFHNNLKDLKAHLGKLNPRGGSGGTTLLDEVNRGITNIRWRRGAVKKMLILTNSPVAGRGYPEHFGIKARKKGVAITSILFGKLNHLPGEKYHRLSTASGGSHHYVSYRQKVYDANGAVHWLYFQRGRLLHGESYDGSWRRGILTYSRYRPAYGKPRIDARELYSDKNLSGPYGLSDRFDRLSGKKIIRSESLENNFSTLSAWAFEKSGLTINGGSKRRVLVSDGEISLWINVTDERLFTLLTRRMDEGSYFPLLVVPRRDRGEPYGLSLTPLPVELSSSDVPRILKTSLTALVKKSKRYLAGSGMRPNGWIISVKVLQAKGRSPGRDIRD